ncbi:6-phosphogluconolactonase [Rubrobacter indicoceani]|uniref:6-phosphogluconolactonase n=1 Tax=Rubrobacter indicoceani TaxID=2051957 RepID=UPI000E5A544E|nr:6-phosphogluconolactonase [Rubrobacter indicoceani]
MSVKTLEGDFNNGATVRVYRTPDELAGAAAEDFARLAAEAVSERGRFVVALAGGSTPKATYRLLAREHAGSVAWDKTYVFFGDERTVGPDSDDSNFGMANDALLRHVSPAGIYRMKGELNPGLAAAMYQETLEDFFGDGEVVFDLIQLGIGDDGHTASLFPNTEALDVADRLVYANPVPQKETVRLTLTAPVIDAARSVEFLVAGEGKADALKAVLTEDVDFHEYPSKRISPSGGPVWLLDEAAAKHLL